MLSEAGDLVVVGAGDAGPCTARAAADRSVSVLVQERTPEGAMAAGHAGEFADDGITVNVVVPGSPAGTAMVPEVSGYRRADLMPPAKMVHPLLWLRSEPADGVTGNRYVAAHRDESASIDEACITSEAPIGWPDLADAPVWPGGKPQV